MLHEQGRAAPTRTTDEPRVGAGRSRLQHGEHQEPGERERETPTEAGETPARRGERPGAPAPACLDRLTCGCETTDRSTRAADRKGQHERLPQHRPEMVDPELREPQRHERRDQRHRDGEADARGGAGDRGGERPILQPPGLLAARSEGEHDHGDGETAESDGKGCR